VDVVERSRDRSQEEEQRAVVDKEGVQNIIEYNFVGNKEFKTIFFDCDWFDPNHGTWENQFGMVEVTHMDQLSGCDPFIVAHRVT
jgi:hypothetical protein